MNSQSAKKILFSILVLAFILRLLSITEGLPAVYNSTEQYLAKHALKMAANRSLDPGFYIYPPFYQYLLVFLYAGYFLFGLVLGIFKDQYDFAVTYLVNPAWFYLLGRILSLLLSLWSVVLIYNLVRRILNPAVALLAAGITAFSYHLFLYGRYAAHESLLIIFTIFALSKYYDILNSDRKSDIILAAAATGMAIAAKYNAGFLVISLFLAIYMRYKLSIPVLLRAFGILAGVFLILNPAIIADPVSFWKGFQVIITQSHYGIITDRSIPYWWELREIISREMIIGVLFLSAIVFALLRRTRYDFVLLATIIPTLLYVGSWTKKGIDYILVCWPPLIVLSAELINDIWERRQFSKQMKYYTILIILFPAVLYTVYNTALIILPDTRQLASEWILQNRGPQDKVCYDKNAYDLYLYDIARFTEYGPNAQNLPEPVKTRLEQYKYLKGQVPMVQTIRYNADMFADSVAFDYQIEQAAVYWKSLAEIKAEGAKWLIVNHSHTDLYTREQKNITPALQNRIRQMQRFYAELEKNYQPRVQFNPGIWRAGPPISIYYLKNEESEDGG